MNPTIYYEDQFRVMVIDRCVTIGANAYSTKSITSVTTAAVSPKRLGVTLAAAIGAGFVFFGVISASHKWSIFGAGLAIICGVAYSKMRTMWQLRISTTKNLNCCQCYRPSYRTSGVSDSTLRGAEVPG